MRLLLIPVLLLGLAAGCSSFKIGPHRIDVQQGNALDREKIERLKPGLSRSQVRFLLGTPLVVDPFHSDRWDYVYLNAPGGELAEQKRITLFFEGDLLARIEGDVPAGPDTPRADPAGAAPTGDSSIVAPLPAPAETPAEPAAGTSAESPRTAEPAAAAPGPQTGSAATQAEDAPAVADADTAAVGDAAVLQAVDAWAAAWARRDLDAYFAAYDANFVPADGISRSAWEARKRRVIGSAKRIAVDIASPRVGRTEEGTVTVTFEQFYRSDSYRDAVVKQLHLVERDGRWLIVEENVLSVLPSAKP